MYKLKLLITGLFGLFSILATVNGTIINCIFDPWNTFIKQRYFVMPSGIDPSLCTHIKYPVDAVVTTTGDVHFSNFDKDYVSHIMFWKNAHPELKVLAGFHLSGMFYDRYRVMIQYATSRKHFVESVVNFTQAHYFNGLDLSWNFYKKRSSLQEKINFVQILKELKEEFKPSNLELSVTIDQTFMLNDLPFDTPKLALQVDFLNGMAFGFASDTRQKFLYDAPHRGEGQMTVTSFTEYWLEKGIPASKFVLGLPFYGNLYRFATTKLAVNAPAAKTMENVSYKSMCHLESEWFNARETDYNASLLIKDNMLFNYDNIKSIREKVNFGNCLGFAGFVVANLEYDDFSGNCGEKHPLLKAIYKKIHK